MRNFISEDDIEQAILAKLKTEPFNYDILICDADPSKRDDLNDGTGRSSKKECVLPNVMLSSLKRINPTIPEDKIKEIVKNLRQDYTGTDIVDTNYKIYKQIRNNIIQRTTFPQQFLRCGFKERSIIADRIFLSSSMECQLCSLN